MNTIKNLLSLDGRVYVYLSCREVGDKFLENAQAEGFMIGDKKPTEAEHDSIFVLNHDMTLNYPSYIGHMAFHMPNSCSYKIIRVDYEKYLAGGEDYIFWPYIGAVIWA